MIEHSQALDIIRKHSSIVETEKVQLTESFHRFLAQDIISPIDMPPFHKSAVDGYACRMQDLPGPLKITETVAAGQCPELTVEPYTCIKIMTGAPIPAGADMVIMIEDTQMLDEQTILYTGNSKATNICVRGEDIQQGQLLLRKGVLLKPWHVGVIATVGQKIVLCARKIRLALLVTGDELLEPGEPFEESKIFNSNAYTLLGLCRELPVDVTYYGIIPDNPRTLSDAFAQALTEADIVLFTGGVSMGEFDHVPDVLKLHGLQILFDSIAIQPGRPLTYATRNNIHCFGLPGNPVSSMLQFELTVKPLIYWMSGSEFKPLELPFTLEQSIRRKKAERTSYYPVRLLDNGNVEPIPYHGSAHLNAFVDAFGVINLQPGQYEIEKGETVYVRPLW